MLHDIKNGIGTCGLLQSTFKHIFDGLYRVVLKVYLVQSCPYYLLEKTLNSAVSYTMAKYWFMRATWER